MDRSTAIRSPLPFMAYDVMDDKIIVACIVARIVAYLVLGYFRTRLQWTDVPRERTEHPAACSGRELPLRPKQARSGARAFEGVQV
jgi:hypothetical protein